MTDLYLCPNCLFVELAEDDLDKCPKCGKSILFVDADPEFKHNRLTEEELRTILRKTRRPR